MSVQAAQDHRRIVPGAEGISSSPQVLDALLKPSSIALVGASPRPDTPGNTMLNAAAVDGYAGGVYAINPRYEKIGERACYPDLASLPQMVDHVVFGIGNEMLEAGLIAAAKHGAKAATIFASCDITGQPDDPLAGRLTAIAREAGITLCGGNCMGFYNPTIGLRVSGYSAALPMRPGNVAFITQSGSAFSALAYSDARIKYSVCVSSGREMTTEAADYMDWVLDQPETGAVGLFLETARSPERLVAALERADRMGIPVVALKVGRSKIAAEFAVSHSGAVAGDTAAWEALFARHGVIAVDTLDQLAANLLMFSAVPLLPTGSLASLHDSGGEREMVADLAEANGVPFAVISDATREKLSANLDAGLHPANPLDVWGTGRDFQAQVEGCMSAMLDDSDTAIGLLFQDIRDKSYVAEGFADALIRVKASRQKPVAIVTNYASVSHRALALRATEAGVPVIDGTLEGLQAVKNLMAFRDRRMMARTMPEPVSSTVVAKWKSRLTQSKSLAPAEAMELLQDYGIPVARSIEAETAEEAIRAAVSVGFPVVLKTAAPDIHHKSDAGGVVLGIRDEVALSDAYQCMAETLGPQVSVSPMVSGRIEVAFGLISDPQFGPVVMMAAGGIFIEVLADRAVAIPPVSREQSAEMLSRLRLSRMMGEVRGLRAVASDSVLDAFARFSMLAADLSDLISELDINPLLVSSKGATAVDVLIVTRAEAESGKGI